YLLYFCLNKKWKQGGLYAMAVFIPLIASTFLSNARSVLGFAAVTPAVDGIRRLQAGMFSGVFGLLNEFFNVAYNPMFDTNVNIVLRSIFYDLFGITYPVLFPYWFLHLLYLGLFFVFLIIMLAVLVKKTGKENSSRLCEKLAGCYNYLAHINLKRFFFLATLCAVALETYVVIGFARPYMMNESTNRYLFMIYPAIYLMLLLVIVKLAGKIRLPKEKWIGRNVVNIVAACVVVLILIVNNCKAQSIYLFPRPEGEQRMEDLVDGDDCILVLTGHWLMTCYTDYLKDAQDIFVTDYVSVFEQEEELVKADTEPFWLIIDVDEFENTAMVKNKCTRDEVSRQMAEEYYLDYFNKIYEGKSIEYVSMDTVFQRNVYLYRVK
ncbi:MAG: hypothetical protein ACI39R_09465, partial [Lachnospiraceae bacterium]